MACFEHRFSGRPYLLVLFAVTGAANRLVWSIGGSLGDVLSLVLVGGVLWLTYGRSSNGSPR